VSAHSTLSNENIENLQNKAIYNDDFEESLVIRSLAGSQLIKEHLLKNKKKKKIL
jgi:hypothetical protein